LGLTTVRYLRISEVFGLTDDQVVIRSLVDLIEVLLERFAVILSLLGRFLLMEAHSVIILQLGLVEQLARVIKLKIFSNLLFLIITCEPAADSVLRRPSRHLLPTRVSSKCIIVPAIMTTRKWITVGLSTEFASPNNLKIICCVCDAFITVEADSLLQTSFARYVTLSSVHGDRIFIVITGALESELTALGARIEERF